ncbi:sarcosine oxidase subunit gamma [Frigidibacter oleivorans]|uniref:sarcosine oxidase subunit gamma n=1 Tax=Frigidibacter oleivorans TaxID=2487129 RepID=UPI000F8F0313|nr:sarcosine oxidase subunit gamma family protein [Frigidibacter oleivorans]
MSEPQSALPGRRAAGFATVAEAGLQGMITLRGDLASPVLAAAVQQATGCAMPGPRRIVQAGDRAAAWMSPDELLLILPHADAPGAATALQAALAGEHALVAEVSDARAMFAVTGDKAVQALAKLFPVDFAAMEPDEIRRSRMAQVAAALWQAAPGDWRIVCFRSVAAYAFGLLDNAVRPGSELTA